LSINNKQWKKNILSPSHSRTVKLDVAEDGLDDLVVEALDGAVVLGARAAALARDGDLEAGARQRHAWRQQTHVREPLLQHNGGDVGGPARVARGLDALARHAVPEVLGQRKLLVQLELHRVVRALLHKAVLLRVAALDPQDARVRIKVHRLDLHRQVRPHPLRVRGPRRALALHFAA
jgi:hypothetical protein